MSETKELIERLWQSDAASALTDEAARALESQAKAIVELVAQLQICAWRNRYDGDLFHDQGIETRQEASWEAYYDAFKVIAKHTTERDTNGRKDPE